MPTFATPHPIAATVDIACGDIRVTAGKRNDTVVDVRPRDDSRDLDVKAAATVRVEYQDEKLLVKIPKSLQIYFTGRVPAVVVTIELPEGSQVHATTMDGDVTCRGDFGDCMLKSSSGDITLDRASAARLSTMDGRLTVDRLRGDGHITGSGPLRIGEIGGKASVKNLNGDSWIGFARADVSLNSAHGSVHIERADADVVARTAHGDVRVGDVARGSVVLQTASGDLEVGVRQGSAAWLDLKSSYGNVRSDLESMDGPDAGSQTVEVRCRTWDGDITIRRAANPSGDE